MSLAQSIQVGTRRLGDAKAVGQVLDLSWRTVYRLADAGKIPSGFKLGASKCWDRLKSKPLSQADANRRKQQRRGRGDANP